MIPEAFIDQCRLLFPSEADALLHSLQDDSPVSLRLNRYKYPGEVSAGTPVPWCPNAFYLAERPSFIADPLWHAGTYYVQEASSMLLQQVWEQLFPKFEHPRVLDACAAPGGKSTHILDMLGDKGFLLANEVIQPRARILCENLTRWGAANVAVSNNDPARLGQLEDFFQVILTDVPCSGEGMFRKDEAARTEWSPEHVDLCEQRQKRILSDLLPALAPGGYLVYSTCTFNHKENEAQLEWLVKEHGMLPVELSIDGPEVTLTEGVKGYRCWPHKMQGEGFFMAVLQKPGEAKNTPVPHLPKPPKEVALLPAWINAEQHAWYTGKEDLYVLDGIEKSDWDKLQRELRIVKSGVRVGSFKHADFIPHHELAYARFLLEPPKAELSLEQAWRYLRREDPGLQSAERGLLLATYKGFGLGWMKFLGNRSNNQLPMDWRILMPENQLREQHIFGK